MSNETIENGKTAAITSYILIVGVLIAISMNVESRNPFASFHIRQAFGLTITFLSLGLIVSNFDSMMISGTMWIFVSILWSYGFFTAIKGDMKPVPLLGNLFQKTFKFI